MKHLRQLALGILLVLALSIPAFAGTMPVGGIAGPSETPGLAGPQESPGLTGDMPGMLTVIFSVLLG